MKRLSAQEFNLLLLHSDKLGYTDKAVNNETRSGQYVTITKGLSVKTYFYGIDKVEHLLIIEQVD